MLETYGKILYVSKSYTFHYVFEVLKPRIGVKNYNFILATFNTFL